MPAGELFTREIRSSETPEDLHWRVVAQLSPLLEPANYKLAAQDAQHVQYSRRYIPTGLLVAVLVALAAAGVVIAAGEGERLGTLLGALAIAALLGVRRREALTVSVHPRPGGSIAVLSGFLTGRARMALLGFEPPQRPRATLASAHRRSARAVRDRPPAH